MMDDVWKSHIELRLQVLEAAAAARPVGTPKVDGWPLDTERGNFEVQKAPPLWLKAGKANFSGRLSELTAEQCDAVAELREWQARKDQETNALAGNGKPKAQYKFMDAASARGWAERHRARLTAVATTFKPQVAKAHRAGPVEADDDEMPF